MTTKSPKILFISLSGDTDNIGIKYLHSALLKAGHDSAILFYTSEENKYDSLIADFIRDNGYDAACISLMSIHYLKAVALSKSIRSICGAGTVIIWGGTHPSIDPQNCLPFADYVCYGEGEGAIVRFFDHWKNSGFHDKVIGFNTQNDKSLTACPVVEDLNSLAFPEHFPSRAYVTHHSSISKLDEELFRKYSRYNGSSISIITSRGCPYECTYCCNHILKKTFGSKIRFRTVENVLDEIGHNIANSPAETLMVHVRDDNFASHNTEWIAAFVSGYMRFGIPAVIQAIPKLLTMPKLELLRRMPVIIGMGLQSGSDSTNKEIYGRQFSKTDFLRMADTLHKYHVPAIYDVILDNPYEGPEHWRETIDVLAHLPRTAMLNFFSLTFYKNTKLYEKAKADGYAVDAHLTKCQVGVRTDSKEYKLLASAQFWPSGLINWLNSGDSAIKGMTLSAVHFVTHGLLKPLRQLQIGFMLQEKSPWRLFRMIRIFAVRQIVTGYLHKGYRTGTKDSGHLRASNTFFDSPKRGAE